MLFRRNRTRRPESRPGAADRSVGGGGGLSGRRIPTSETARAIRDNPFISKNGKNYPYIVTPFCTECGTFVIRKTGDIKGMKRHEGLIKSTACMLALSVLFSCGPTRSEHAGHQQNTTHMEKVNLGNLPALYPKPLTVVGAEVEGRVNWLVVGHTGIIGHDRILVSMSKSHHTNQGIKDSKKLSINLVSREMLPKADYVGSVSGASVDKSKVFEYHWGENGTPVIDISPLTMECDVVEIYETEGFDNFICSIANTYAAPDVLDSNGKLDYTKLKPVLFEFPTYSYIATGEIIGKCLNLDKQPGMCAKEPMTADGIVRLSKVEVYPQYLDEYMEYATEVGEVSLRTEPGVLTMYAVSEKENPCKVTILETYASREAYEKHIASEHFQRYKQGTLHMVKSLVLSDQTPLNPANKINNFIQ